MTAAVDEVSKQFTKKELHKIAEELEIGVDIGASATSIVSTVIGDLDENGVPEIEDCSDLLAEFLVAAEYIDENGNPVQEEEEKSSEEPVIDDAKKPECFGFQDSRDPACAKCKVVAACTKERVRTRPTCFGKLFKAHDPECQACLEFAECKGA